LQKNRPYLRETHETRAQTYPNAPEKTSNKQSR
jgi:hypothetical protein